MLVGQKVPHRGRYTPTATELQRWAAYRQQNRVQASRAFGVAQALAEVRSADWQWDNQFYRRMPA